MECGRKEVVVERREGDVGPREEVRRVKGSAISGEKKERRCARCRRVWRRVTKL